jgi:predicted nucleotidyltransferase
LYQKFYIAVYKRHLAILLPDQNSTRCYQKFKKCIKQLTTAEPIQIFNKLETQKERKRHRYKGKTKNYSEEKQNDHE